MIRYSQVEGKNKREIVLLKGFPCMWGHCAFCDYIHDNSLDVEEMAAINADTLQNVTGKYQVLEVINSGSVFELPQATLLQIKMLAQEKYLRKLCFESYYAYKERLQEMRDFFGEIEIIFKCGIETFDNDFRNKILKKGILFEQPSEVAKYFDSVCLLIGIEGQTKEMISKDIEILLKYFSYGCINLYINNTTAIKADFELQRWFMDTYSYLEQYPNIDVLWNNTDFGVGGETL